MTRRLPWAPIVVVALAAALRLHGLGAESLDLDEASSLAFAARRLARVLVADRGNPPLYYVFLKGWIGLAGTGEIAVRLPSVLFGIATVAALHALVRELYGRGAALAAALLLALSTPHIAFSQNARMYALAILLAVASTHALVRARVLGGGRRWAGYTALAVALIYTHFSGLIVLAGHGAAVLVARGRRREALVAALVVAVAIAPGVARGLLSVEGYRFWQPHVSLDALAALAESWIAGGRALVADTAWPALGLALPAVLVGRRDHLVMLYGGLLPFIALAIATPVWQPRYLAVLLPLFVAGLAASRRAWLSVVFVAVAAAGVTAAKLAGPIGEDWRGAAAFVGDGPVVIAGPDYLCLPLRYYRAVECSGAASAEAIVARAPRAVIYPALHFPADPTRRSAAELGPRTDADLRLLHVTRVGR